jgi:hypothetical protein
MSKCTDYQRHEFWCDHPDKLWRWRTFDGCQGSCCADCFYLPLGPNFWRDIQSLSMIDSYGIPYDRKGWTEADAIGDMLRRVQLGMLR